MTDIPLKAKIYCTDGEAGTSTAVVVDPLSQIITHIVIESDYNEHLVLLEHVAQADHDSIKLDCTKEELRQMPPFREVQYIGGAEYSDYMGTAWEAPYVTSYPIESQVVAVEMVPAGELAIHRGDPVQATDGQVGHVGEFIVDSDSGHISHLVLRKGHLWGKREVTLGLDLIDKVEAGVVYLNVNKKAVEQLPAVKVKRHYRG
jgi:sporulation protein YlmC with PRC-barrel domain